MGTGHTSFYLQRAPMTDNDDRPTEIADLQHLTLDEVFAQLDHHEEEVARLLYQVDRPRHNIGTGPPGRVD